MAHAVSKPQLARAIAAMKAQGIAVRGLLCLPDGSTAVLTEAPVIETPSASGASWVDLLGDGEDHGAGG